MGKSSQNPAWDPAIRYTFSRSDAASMLFGAMLAQEQGEDVK